MQNFFRSFTFREWMIAIIIRTYMICNHHLYITITVVYSNFALLFFGLIFHTSQKQKQHKKIDHAIRLPRMETKCLV